MMTRCYSQSALKKSPSYGNCFVCDDWLNYGVFKQWHDDNYVESYHLDKDIIKQGNNLYSPEFCSYVPSLINKIVLSGGSSNGKYPKGVSIDNRTGKFVAHLNIDGKIRHIGSFDCQIKAGQHYLVKKKEKIRLIARKYYADALITKPVYYGLMKWDAICQ